MAKTLRKNISKKTFSKKNKKSKKNVQHYSKKSKINKMRGGKDLDASLLDRIKKNDPTLKELNISNYKIGDKGAIELAEALKINTNLKTIDISNNEIGTSWFSSGYKGGKALLQALAINKTLTSLNTTGNKLGNSEIAIKVLLIRNRSYEDYIINLRGQTKNLPTFIKKITNELNTLLDKGSVTIRGKTIEQIKGLTKSDIDEFVTNNFLLQAQ